MFTLMAEITPFNLNFTKFSLINRPYEDGKQSPKNDLSPC